MADKFRTGDGPIAGRLCYTVNMPANLWFVAEVADLLTDLADERNWEQVGNVSIDDAVQAAMRLKMSFGPQIGLIFPFITALPPTNCIECDGSTYNRVDYPDLYATLDGAFIVDADTFRVPDLRGRSVIGAGTGSGLSARAVNDSGGEESHTLVVGEMPSHSHTDLGHTHAEGTAAPNLTTIGPGAPEATAIPSVGVTGIGSANLTSTGGDGSHNNMQPYLALKYCVVAT